MVCIVLSKQDCYIVQKTLVLVHIVNSQTCTRPNALLNNGILLLILLLMSLYIWSNSWHRL